MLMIAKHKFWRVLTRIHKWAGLIIGIQIILWFASGLFMSFFDIDTVHGDLSALKKQFPLTAEQTIHAQDAIGHYGGDELLSVSLFSAMGAPVWKLDGPSGRMFVDARTGDIWQGLTIEKVREAAGHYYIGEGQVDTVTKLDTAPSEFRGGPVPVWQFKYDDKARTRLYISPQTGDLLKTRTRLWRAFDFMWMLHVMGYPDRDNINSWWLVLAAFCGFLFALTGTALVVHRVFLRPRAKKEISPRS